MDSAVLSSNRESTMTTIQVVDLKKGDMIRVTTPERQVNSRGLGGGPKKTKPQTVEVMEVISVGTVAGQVQAYCKVVIDAKGQETSKVFSDLAIPCETLYQPHEGQASTKLIELMA